MPERSLHSSIHKWPDQKTVDLAVREWAASAVQKHPETRRIGYYGSYARGDWGVGSDVDLIVLVSQTDKPFEQRGLDWDALDLPVPADVIIYSETEWEHVKKGRLGRVMEDEVVWVKNCPLKTRLSASGGEKHEEEMKRPKKKNKKDKG